MTHLSPAKQTALQSGLVIPAHPLALTAERRLDERHQRALTRYYCAAGAGGVAVGVHTTQFEIHDPEVGLLRPVLELAAETITEAEAERDTAIVKIAGLVGHTAQALTEAALARDLGYDLGLISLAAFADEPDEDLLEHCRRVGEVIPLFGFYLQPAVGGRRLSYRFWRQLAENPALKAIKIAPFNRYQTLDVVQAIADAGRAGDIALYTGNDDNIIVDLLTPFALDPAQKPLRIVGGLLGQWAVWTQQAVQDLTQIKNDLQQGVWSRDWLAYGTQLTLANAAIFDAAHQFHGCISGIHLVLQRQGLLRGTWCFNTSETLSPGQAEAIAAVQRRFPHLGDDDFVEAHRDTWLR